MNAPALEIERAYRSCDEITRHAAANLPGVPSTRTSLNVTLPSLV